MAEATHVNDDELEENWVPQAVAVSDDEDALSAGSEDEFEDEQDLELASAKRAREEAEEAADEDVELVAEAPAAPKKQKTDAVVCQALSSRVCRSG
jgi:hypothetical protein